MAMAMQTGVASSKVLILLGAGLTGSVILKNGQLSDVLLHLQEYIKGINDVDFSSTKIDPVFLAAQIRQLAQEIRELSLSNPITIMNGGSGSSGGYGSYLVPAAALGAMGYCYMWWKGLSFSDVMFVTKQNMATAVSSVSKQLDNLTDALATTKKHLSKRLETLDWKLEEQKEISGQIHDDVIGVKSNISQIGFDIDSIREMINGLEGKLELLEGKQDLTNSGVYYLCQVAGGITGGPNARLVQDVGSKLDPPKVTCEDTSRKGLQFLTDSTLFESVVEKPLTSSKVDDFDRVAVKTVSSAKVKTRLHRSYPVGISLAHDII
ncbi:hypothetical protein SOVF_163880 [Spinacia oleracea]|uniref:DUF1664 domain-containing protein n=1 Tax=Spinacia oleracea TaxID=3562 RepID=A0A9R0INX9_SPIOL|nr:uncharacterized protein LOC110791473 [Spinacia oleracea]KNA08301.1 hypothetical protein SOVF_163880 [Spinacia oleracea]